MSTRFWLDRRPNRAVSREGLTTGLLGAAVVALFYLAVDVARGRPFMTPSVLGDAFILRRPVRMDAPDITAVLVYTAIHILAFVGFGLLLAAFARASERSSLARYAIVQLLVAFVVFFYGVVSIGSEVVRGFFPFVGILMANALAGMVMLAWLWRRHPMLRVAIARTPLGASDSSA